MDSGNHLGAFLFGVVIGAIGGALAALFMAPKPGHQLRHEFKDQAGGVQQLISDTKSSVRDRSEGLVGTYVDKVTRMVQHEDEEDGHVVEVTKSVDPPSVSAVPEAEPTVAEGAKPE